MLSRGLIWEGVGPPQDQWNDTVWKKWPEQENEKLWSDIWKSNKIHKALYKYTKWNEMKMSFCIFYVLLRACNVYI